MPYSLDKKITAYLSSIGVQSATIRDGKLYIGEKEAGEMSGLITRDKLIRMVSDFNTEQLSG